MLFHIVKIDAFMPKYGLTLTKSLQATEILA
jgi:hypothetical protein